MTPGIVLRSCLFALFQIVITPVFAVVALATFPFTALTRYRIITGWSRLTLAAARIICGIRYRVLGAEHIPRQPCVILANHQSAWETLAFQVIFPPQVWVVKRELLWIPFFGWGLAMLSPIAIDRGAGARALRQTLEQGRRRLSQGFCIVIFPEGTRVAPDMHRDFHAGGAWVAIQAGVPVLPVAHDSGRLWGRNAFLKRPGLVTVSVGPPIPTGDADADELMQRAERWIRNEVQRMAAPGKNPEAL